MAISGNILYVDDISANHIGEYNATTGATINSNWASSSGSVFQLSIYLNDLYVPEFGNSALTVINLTTALPETNYTSPSGLNKPYGAFAVPEPGSTMLLTTGVAAFVGRRRRGARKSD